MVVISRIFSRGYGGLQSAKIIRYAVRGNSSTAAQDSVQESQINKPEQNIEQKKVIPDRYRFIYPEFLPDPDPKYRNSLREKLERMDMLARRTHIAIPEFYVGSILAITYSEPHAPGKINKFVGICIERKGCGLRATCLLRNMVNNQGIEVLYELYDPAIQKIECLRLEKRLDPHLRYLRDAPAEYSTFPFDMEPEYLPEDTSVPVNEIKVQINPRPWLEKWEQQELRGIGELDLSERRIKRAKAIAKPWEKYDLMKKYRETIPEEDQNEIFNEVHTKLHVMEIAGRRQKHKRTFVRPQKTG
ncbi:PREDICTED: 39S ribosomal protein L19, mitochondrial [Cyphomyrmex costatus]|uniref:Large ribosomal subunit protein bL19m n=1 Tax=Cyphomyrmex costatus TaxID=456900 RepID=A0A195CJ46_9HYME|nr:PREDICTED: 39S ribosomal protein L19, mitochondrial [Cyphomyrmex costatus]KYN00457.1 39S ribosomal protein L19, mitochondrial [Cyphomyrmex costatus]